MSPPGELPLSLFQNNRIRGTLNSEGFRGACSEGQDLGLASDLRRLLCRVEAEPSSGKDQWQLPLFSTVCFTCNLLICPSVLVSVWFMVVSRLEPRASAPKAGTLLPGPQTLTEEGSRKSWRLQTQGWCLLTPRHADHRRYTNRPVSQSLCVLFRSS